MEDVEDPTRTAHRTAGQAYFDSVLAKAHKGSDPFQQQPLKPRHAPIVTATAEDPDVAAFGTFLDKHRTVLLLGALVVLQALSWVLMKDALNHMHTPAVLTFLHMIAAATLQLVLASWQLVDQPKMSSKAVKGALVHAVLNGVQVLLVMAVLMYSSVYMLLCWIIVMPVLLKHSRAADISSKSVVKPVPPQLRVPMLVACTGLGIEFLADSHKGLVPMVLLACWCCTVGMQLLWQQVKVDATLGHKIMDPGFLFRARELSDVEDLASPSTLLFMSNCLPAVPVLVVGLLCLEGKDLVEHEPSVPTLSVLLLSCLAYAGAASLRVMLADTGASMPALIDLSTAFAAVLAIVLDFMEGAHGSSFLGACIAACGVVVVHMMRWQSLRRHGGQLRML